MTQLRTSNTPDSNHASCGVDKHGQLLSSFFGIWNKGVGVLSVDSLDVRKSMDAYSREYCIKSFKK